jgi:subtilisin family serine protease
MTLRLPHAACVLLLCTAACHSGARTISPRLAPAPAAMPSTAPASGLAEAPPDWQLLDEAADTVPGISVRRAERELLAGKPPKAPVLVAVIDGGIDTAHVDLKANLWTRPADAPADGHPNESHGWNFIGGPSGQNVGHDTYELTRVVARCRQGGVEGGTPPVSPDSTCVRLDKEFMRLRGEAERQLANVQRVAGVLDTADKVLERALGPGPLTVERVQGLQATESSTARAQQVYLSLAKQGGTPAAVARALTGIQSRVNYGLNPSYDPRPIVGDQYGDVREAHYGNADVMGPDALHGTHVAGIIGAVRGNGVGIDGVAPAVRIMMVRAVPDGDERDKDIANAIRFAVDHGARVINMSFGKSYSPQKVAVDDAVRYAAAHDVLLVHAAGNDGQDVSMAPTFPSPVYLDGETAPNWIEVGASSWAGGDRLAAPFSNYSKTKVDVFAPGVDILSTVPGNAYARESGTSMAAPVVTGLAAFLLDYYPHLSAVELKRIILQSATPYPDEMVIRPGSKDERVPFGSLSVTGGIVNAYAALRMARDVAARGGRGA